MHVVVVPANPMLVGVIHNFAYLLFGTVMMHNGLGLGLVDVRIGGQVTILVVALLLLQRILHGQGLQRSI